MSVTLGTASKISAISPSSSSIGHEARAASIRDQGQDLWAVALWTLAYTYTQERGAHQSSSEPVGARQSPPEPTTSPPPPPPPFQHTSQQSPGPSFAGGPAPHAWLAFFSCYVGSTCCAGERFGILRQPARPLNSTCIQSDPGRNLWPTMVDGLTPRPRPLHFTSAQSPLTPG